MKMLLSQWSQSFPVLGRKRVVEVGDLFCSFARRFNYITAGGSPLRIRLLQQHYHFSTLSSSDRSSLVPFACCGIVNGETGNAQNVLPTIGHDMVRKKKCSGCETDGDFHDHASEEEDIDEDYSYSGNHGSSHIPVLLSEVIEAFQDVELHTFVDCTLGAAGHASSIITNHPELRSFIGFDVDPVAHAKASSRIQEAVEQRTKSYKDSADLQIHMIKSNFRNIKSALHQLGLESGQVDGLLMDLGMSSMQLDYAERGFSLQLDGPLDMRMDPMSTTTASDILNGWSETEIGRILRDYGEERQWRRLAQRITEARHAGSINTTSGLLQVIQKSLPTRFSPGRPGWKKTAIRVFQALRIAVNDELTSLESALPHAFNCLRPGGRMAIISFHSLEDRIVKRFFLKAMGETVSKKSKKFRDIGNVENEPKTNVFKALEGTCALILTRRPLTAGLDELKSNPRARSAKLRILVKK